MPVINREEVFPETTTTAMGSLLAQLGVVVTKVFGYIGNICSTIVDNPLLLMTTGFLLIGACIAIFGRLLSKN